MIAWITERMDLKEAVPRCRSTVVVVTFLLIAVWFVMRVVAPSAQRLTHGYGAYYSASRLLAEGRLSAAIYDPDYFRPQVRRDSDGQADDIYNANPPTTALLLLPLAPLPSESARLIWTVLNLLLLFGGLALLLFTFSRSTSLGHALGIFALAMLFQPVVQNFYFGQAYILIFFLLAVAAIAFHRRRSALGATSLGLALLLKTAGTPLLLLLVWQKRWRYLALLIALTLLVLLVTLPLFPLDMWLAYRQLLPEATGGPWVCVTAYQTTRSLLCHLFTFRREWNPTPVAHLPLLASTLLLLLGGLTLLAIFVRASKRPTVAFLGMIAWSVLFAPIGEQHHHTVMLIPLTWLIVSRPSYAAGAFSQWASRLGLALLLAFYFVPFDVNHPAFQQGWRALVAYPRLYGGWLVLLLCFQRLWEPVQSRIVADNGVTVDYF